MPAIAYATMKNNEYSLALLCDFYEITMGRGYFHSPMKNDIAYFDVFFRKVPDGGGYAVAACRMNGRAWAWTRKFMR